MCDPVSATIAADGGLNLSLANPHGDVVTGVEDDRSGREDGEHLGDLRQRQQPGEPEHLVGQAGGVERVQHGAELGAGAAQDGAARGGPPGPGPGEGAEAGDDVGGRGVRGRRGGAGRVEGCGGVHVHQCRRSHGVERASAGPMTRPAPSLDVVGHEVLATRRRLR